MTDYERGFADGRAAERAEWVRDVGAMRELQKHYEEFDCLPEGVSTNTLSDAETTVDARLASASGEQKS